jgi:hypothetical protein
MQDSPAGRRAAGAAGPRSSQPKRRTFTEVHATELGELAKDFMSEAVRLNGGVAPHAIHADRGTSMTSKPVSALLSDLAILKIAFPPESQQ